ncbi:MAG: glycosyltransferase family 2 protein [Candidatus Nanopelagicales bacterium]|nr:glycosyltransferase family 2 protein [Candidatus Nanopelagicales bacterium]
MQPESPEPVDGQQEPAQGALAPSAADDPRPAPIEAPFEASPEASQATADEDQAWSDWFSESDDPAAGFTRRHHHVTTVLVSHDGATWLPAVLTTLATQTRQADAVVGVDTGSSDDSADLLRRSFGRDRVVTLGPDTGFGEAVRAGLAQVGQVQVAPSDDAGDLVTWVWLLHDDSAPDPSCLEALLTAADREPSVAVLGPKILGWHDQRLLLEAGFSVTGAGRRFTGLERREHDQGQHDGVRDVLAVSTAGMLVRRDVWDRLDGLDPNLPLFRDDLDFCWRAHRAGERVIVTTDAVLHHREASAHGRRAAAELAQHPHRADREAAVHVLLAQSRALAAPFIALRLLLASAVRALMFLLGKDFAAAGDEVKAVLNIALHPRSLAESRRRIHATSVESVSVVNHLRPRLAWQMRQAWEALIGIASTSGASSAQMVSAVESGPADDDSDYLDVTSSGLVRRLLVRPSVVMVAALTLFAAIATHGLWWGDGVLQGGALLPTPDGAADIWTIYTQGWHDIGPGSNAPAPPYLLAVFAAGALLLGKSAVAVQVVVLLGLAFAGWAAYFTLRGVIISRPVRIWAAVMYAVLPPVTGAMTAGRLGTIIAAIAFPFALRSCVRLATNTGSVRRAAGTALLLSVLIAAVPLFWLIALIFAVALGTLRWRSEGAAAKASLQRLAIAILAPIVLLAPWSLQLFTQPVRFLIGAGEHSLSDPGLSPVAVLLIHPGGPGMTPVWITAGLVVAGLLALLRRDRLTSIALAVGLGIVGLMFAMLQTIITVTPPGATDAIRPWPGPATLVWGAGLILAAALAADGLRQSMGHASFSLEQPLAVAVTVIAVLTPAAAALLWFPSAGDVLQKASASAVPAFVAAESVSPQAPRTLMLRQDGAGRVLYSLLNGPGPVLGDADMAPPGDVWAPIDEYVAALASGRGGTEIAGLSGYGIRFILLAQGTSADLIPVLDGEPGLRRLSSASGEVLWRVDGVTSRARLLTGAVPTEVPVVGGNPERVAATGVQTRPYIDAAVPADAAARVLVLGATQDSRWSATATDAATGATTALEPVAPAGSLAWSQGFTLPTTAAQVTVTFESGTRALWLWLQVGVLVLLVMLALPTRQLQEIDPDLEGLGFSPEAVRHD